MQSDNLDLTDGSARYPVDFFSPTNRDLIEHLHALGQIRITEENGQRYVASDDLDPYIPPHP